MESALTSFLLADAGIAAAVGTRVNWAVLPQAFDRPNIVLTLIAGDRNYTGAAVDRLVQTVVQIDAWATTMAAALAIANLIETRLSGFRGTHGGIEFAGVFLNAVRSGVEKTPSEELHRVSSDYTVWSQQ